MGTHFPPSSRSEESKSEGHGPTTGGILYGVAFIVLSALIFTVILQPRPIDLAAPAEAVRPSMPNLPLTYPPTRTVDAADIHFGVKVADPYRWLEDGKAPDVHDWLG